PEQIFAFADIPSHVAADQHHVGCVTGLATRFGILFGEERPQPVLVSSVTFLHAGGGAAIALMTRRAAKFIRIVDLQKFGLGMANEGLSVFVRSLLSLGR